ncbi:Hypothetical predicted protein [Octopus vulgaris]|uniref:Uncharacterized protein n=1 Tax=Octopus vulgaris TaxID=6645 RepID=A0AA36FFA0_OCTVU|nr:Hypothetical predicted protein [Octopus vulgaris]
MHRAGATDKKTVLLNEGDTLNLSLCVRRTAFYSIASICYSNDGFSDNIIATLDGIPIGNFTSKTNSKYGVLWNNFYISDRITESMVLETGVHHLELFVHNSDKYGIEIDSVNIETNDTTVGESILACYLQCLANFDSTKEKLQCSARSNMELVQRSFPTLCAEQDNIDIALFHPNILKYRIVASYPKYNTSLNLKHAEFKNCENLSPSLLWRLSEKEKTDSSLRSTLMSFKFRIKKKIPFVFKIEFNLKGKAEGLIDSDVGSVLDMHFTNVEGHFSVGCSYTIRGGHLSPSISYLITPGHRNQTWGIPDYTWSEHQWNAISCRIASASDQTINIKYIQLSRRNERGEKQSYIYKDDDIIIKGVNVDFWWRRPKTILINYKNKYFPNIDFVVIYRRVPTTANFHQIFVLYQDGNSRTLPLPPEEVDWIPFGSSVIIGQSNLSDYRPVSEITRIQIMEVIKDRVRLKVNYYDGGAAIINILSKRSVTEILVTPLIYKRSLSTFPFARFRSMWIIDGQCDVDHLQTDNNRPRGILDGWRNMKGCKVNFFRMCQSSHLTLSPDIMIEILP